jgi:hypothetical protein
MTVMQYRSELSGAFIKCRDWSVARPERRLNGRRVSGACNEEGGMF